MKLGFLETLIAVVRHGSFAAAANEVNLTASAVGLQMKQLEEYFGQPLFDRSARQARPTDLAREIAATTEGTLETLERYRSRMEVAVSGHMRLGVIESALVTLLPPLVRSLRSDAPALELHISRGVSPYLLGELKAGRLDAAIVVRPETGGSSRLSWTTVLKEPFVLVTPSWIEGDDPCTVLTEHDWIRLDRNVMGGRIAASYVERTVPGKRSSLDLPGTDAVVATVAAGVGVSVIPAVRSEVQRAYGFREISLGPKAPTREIALVCRAADAENRKVEAVLTALRQAASERAAASSD